MTPEDQVFGRGLDIWALGITVYMMIFDKHPFAEVSIRHEKDLHKALLERDLEFPRLESGEFLDQSGQDILKKMLNKDPDSRIKIDEVLKHPFLQGHLEAAVQESENLRNPQSTTSLGQFLKMKQEGLSAKGVDATPINIGELAESQGRGFEAFAQRAGVCRNPNTSNKDDQSPQNDTLLSGKGNSRTSISPKQSPGKGSRLGRLLLDSLTTTKQLTSKVVSKQTVQLKIFKNSNATTPEE